ncbi:MAG: bifunctional enoyl-CoA hydratase/phosphate acetyltransferase [bacterium]
MIKSLDEIVSAITEFPRQKVAVAVAESASVLEAVKLAHEQNIADALLVGDRAEIEAVAKEVGYDLAGAEIIDEAGDLEAAKIAAHAVREGRADALMKGHIHTDDFLRALLDKETGLRAGVIMSHCFLLDHRAEKRLIIVTDAAMNIKPDVVQKAQIVLNAVLLAECLGMSNPRVGVLAAVELVNPNMPATLDAAALMAMDRRGQFPTCRLDGPFALDNAINLEAAKIKKISGEVAGQCDILLVPNIESGNILAKSFSFLAKGLVAGVLIGAAAPVVLTSRADSAQAKLYSIALAVLMAGMERKHRLKIGKVHF